MDILGPRAIQALALWAACGTIAAHAGCGSINGAYADDSVEKLDGVPRTLSSFASPRERARLVHQEQSGPKPTFGGTGQVMQRPKTVKLVARVEVAFAAELKLRYLDESGKLLAETMSTTPRKWNCIGGRLERKFQTASGLGEVMRTEEIVQVLSAEPGGDLALIETSRFVDGTKAAPKETQVHFKRLKAS